MSAVVLLDEVITQRNAEPAPSSNGATAFRSKSERIIHRADRPETARALLKILGQSGTLFDRSEAEPELLAAVRRCGLLKSEAWRNIASAWRDA